jgi:hypothetical protein
VSRIGVQITKEISFRDNTQEFHNVYHFEHDGTNTEALASALIDYLVGVEKTFHTSSVSFVHARAWSAGGTEAQNNMLSEKTLTGTGSNATTVSTLDRERAFLFQWRAGNDSRGHAVFLRKWYHTCGGFPGAAAPSTSVIANTTGFSTADRNGMATSAAAVAQATINGITMNLCAKSGRQVTGGYTPTAHKYLEHHQLGDQWRG